MLHVYFDTNVYDHIEKGYISAEEVSSFRVAVGRGEVVAHLSVADIEELLGQWETDRQSPVRRLQVARDLVGFDGILKQPADLLREAIRAYAAGAPLPSSTLPRRERQLLKDCLSRIAHGSGDLSREVSQIVVDVKKMKEAFRFQMERGIEQTLAEPEWKSRDIEEWRTVTFEVFWKAGAMQWAEDLAKPLGLAEACRVRGLDGLLDVPAVRLCVGAAMSLVFSEVVEERKPRLSDAYDLWHAIMASVADVFVTRDEGLASLLARVPVDGFRVVTSLHTLLAN